ncbi:hypothetical protein HDU82_003161, partial [Entophlyctis luteolus]
MPAARRRQLKQECGADGKTVFYAHGSGASCETMAVLEIPKMSASSTLWDDLFSDHTQNSPETHTPRLPCAECRMLRKRVGALLCFDPRVWPLPQARSPLLISQKRRSAQPACDLGGGSFLDSANHWGEFADPKYLSLDLITCIKWTHKVSSISQRLSEVEKTLSNLTNQATQEPKEAQAAFHETAACMLESRDMMPTFQDWAIACSYMMKKPYSIIGVLGGSDEFLESFFSQPPHLWLTLCAVASQLQEPKLPEHVRYSYYSRAQNALVKNFHILDFKMFQSLLIFAAFSIANGKPEVGRPFFFQPMALTFEFNGPRQRYPADRILGLISLLEKFVLFCSIDCTNYEISVTQIVIGAPLPVQLQSNRIKFARRLHANTPFYSEYPERSEVATICYLCAILDVLESAAQLHHKPPATMVDLTESILLSSVKAQLESLKSQIPAYLVLLVDGSGDRANDLAEFVSDFRMTEMKVADVLTTSLLLHSTVCISNRSLLYLTGFMPAESIDPASESQQAKVLAALDVAVTSARTILFLVSWLYNRSESGVDGDFGRFRRRFWKTYTFYSMAILEAAIVAWFACTRTHPSWWQSPAATADGFAETVLGRRLRMDVQDWRIIRTQMADALRTLTDLEEDLSPKAGRAVDAASEQQLPAFNPTMSNMVSPMIEAVNLIVQDMESAEACAAGGSRKLPLVDAEDGPARTIGVRVSALSADDYEQTQPYEGHPWAFLGLLGARVGAGRVAWRSQHEDDWRAFWADVERNA